MAEIAEIKMDLASRYIRSTEAVAIGDATALKIARIEAARDIVSRFSSPGIAPFNKLEAATYQAALEYIAAHLLTFISLKDSK